jgi:polar amino acid transport system substrate-binding protein
MTMKSQILTLGLRALAGVAVASLALTGCSNVDDAGTGSTGATAFDAGTVHEDPALAALVPAAMRAKGTLVVGSDTTYAPAEFLGGSDGQTPMGFDVDLAKAMGSVLGLKVEYQSSQFATILPSLGSKYDLGISAFSITTERMKAVNMVSYFQAGSVWAVRKGNPTNADRDNMCGKKVGVQTGSIQEDPDLSSRNQKCLEAGKPAIDIVSLKNQTDVTTRLMAGGIDAMVSGATTITYAIKQSGGEMELLGDMYDPSPVGIATSKDDLDLANLVAKTMNKLIATGDYKRILDGWGIGILAIDKSAVNPVIDK